MDLKALIDELNARKAVLENAIGSLKEIQQSLSGGPQTSEAKRGRKSMDEEERREVSERMKRYWASRRMAPDSGTPAE